MKIRQDFVTNSSSSSFIIAKKYLDEDQLYAIRNHSTVGDRLKIPYAFEDAWTIRENDDFISASTWMDNFDMCKFLRIIDVPVEKATWGEYPFYLDTSDDDEEQNDNIEDDIDFESESEPETNEKDWHTIIQEDKDNVAYESCVSEDFLSLLNTLRNM